MYDILLAVVIGVLIGIIAAFFGIGGGVLFVPTLVLFFGLDIKQATGTSLLAIFITAISSTYAYFRQKRIMYSLGVILEFSTIAGTVIGAYLAVVSPSIYLRIAFSIVLIFASLNMIRKALRKTEVKSDEVKMKYNRKNLIWAIIASFFAGIASACLGIGGGVLKVPILCLVLQIPIHYAVATSCFMILITSFSGVLQRGLYGHVVYKYGISLGIGAIAGAQIGARLAKKTKPKILSILFGILLIIVALRLII